MATALVTQIAYAVQSLFDPAGTAGRLIDLGKLANYGLLTSFTPAYLFTSGVNGAWYDPSDVNLTWRRNLLTYTEQFDNAAWAKQSATITADATLAPNGTLTTDLLLETAVNSQHYVLQTVATNASSVTLSFYVKPAGRTRVRIRSESPQTGVLSNDFTLVGAGSVANPSAGSITQAEYGFYLCTVKSTTNGTGASGYHLIQTLDDSGNDTYAGDITKGIYIWGAQLERGSTATPYQRITDGVQDYLQYQAQPVLYQDSAGTTPVTAVEQPVGLMLDKSKWLVLGPELVTNGDFSNGTTGWTAYSAAAGGTISVSSGALLVSNNGGTYARGVTTLSGLTIGRVYKCSASILGSTNTARVRISTVASADAGYTYNGDIITGSANISFCFFATATTHYFSGLIESTVGTATATFDNFSVRELPGNPAFNPSGNSANFPVLSARYNLLTQTETFVETGKYFPANVTVTNTAGIAPDGSNTAVKLAATATATTTFYYEAALGQTAYKHVWYIKSGVLSGSFGNTLILRNTTTSTNIALGSIDLTTGVVTNTLGTAFSSSDAGGGWWQVTAVISSGFAATDIVRLYYGWSSAAAAAGDYILVWRPDCRHPNDALNQPAYQRVNTATDYDTVGFKPYLRFNGVNQWLQTNSIDFSYGDKMFVCAGVRKLSDAAAANILELSSIYVNPGAFAVFAPSSASARYGFISNGTSSSLANTAPSYAAPITNVISGIGDISGDQAILRVNGAQAAISTSDQGTGNYGNYPLYIGARGGSSLWFNGRLHQLVVAGKQASASEISSTETYLNQKTGAY